MKNFKFLGLSLVATAMVFLTSCLDGNNTASGVGYGFITTNAAYKQVLRANTTIGMADFVDKAGAVQNKMTGEYCIFTFDVDFDEQNTAEYTLMTMTGYQKLEEQQTAPLYPDDITHISTYSGAMEQTFTAVEGITPVQEKYFLTATLDSIVDKQTTRYSLYYDKDSVNVESLNGTSVNVYTLYIKATRDKSEKAEAQQVSDVAAFDLSGFISQARYIESEKDAIYFRFKFVKKYTPGTDGKYNIEWGESETLCAIANPEKNK